MGDREHLDFTEKFAKKLLEIQNRKLQELKSLSQMSRALGGDEEFKRQYNFIQGLIHGLRSVIMILEARPE
jgi:hypothetical protein